MEELWKEIRGYEGLYEVSNLGRVRRTTSSNRLHTNGVLKPIYRNKYLKVVLSRIILSIGLWLKHLLKMQLIYPM